MERDLEIEENQTNNELLKSQIAIRCAKAALLLSSLKSTPPNHNKTRIDKEERERLSKEVADLKVELVKERYKNRHMKLCSAFEFALQIAVLLSFSGFCLIVANYRFI